MSTAPSTPASAPTGVPVPAAASARDISPPAALPPSPLPLDPAEHDDDTAMSDFVAANDTASSPTAAAASPTPRAIPTTTRVTAGAARRRKGRSLYDRVEAFISRLSTRNNFWHRVCSLIWLPFAFRSGITMKRVSETTFQAILPFRRFNRNWYNAMAGAALLGNAEIAGGMYVFGVAGGDYTVVCKHLEYKFLRPCFGPAVYRITPREDIQAHLAHAGEFNITIDLDIFQAVVKPGDREKRVGRCSATFHVTPKMHHKSKAARDTAPAQPQ